LNIWPKNVKVTYFIGWYSPEINMKSSHLIFSAALIFLLLNLAASDFVNDGTPRSGKERVESDKVQHNSSV